VWRGGLGEVVEGREVGREDLREVEEGGEGEGRREERKGYG